MGISSAVSASAVARVLGIEPIFKDLRGGAALFLPQRIAVVGQGNTLAVYSSDKATVTSAFQVGETYGHGSPLHLAVRELLPDNGDGVGIIPVTVYPLDDDGAGVVSVGDITPTGSPTEDASYYIEINGIKSESFTVSVGDTLPDIVAAMATAVNAVLHMPVIAATAVTPDRCEFTSKWKGASANDLKIKIVGSTTAGVTYGVTQPTGGANNPDVDPALALMGNVWETMVLNCLDVADTASLTKYQTFGDGRWGALVRKPLVVFSGSVAVTPAAAIAVPDARKTDKVNAQLVAPGSDNLPLVVAARQLARIVVVANDNPPRAYGSLQATGLLPGADGDQWDNVQRETAVQGGSSTVEVRDGVVNVGDVVTFYHPDGDSNPAYRHVVDIVKLQNVLFNMDLEFVKPEWDGAPLIPDNQPTVNRSAKQPKMVVAAAAAILDGLGAQAIISDPKSAKASTTAEIDAGNPKRINMTTTVQLSGNTNIISVDLNFGFYFG